MQVRFEETIPRDCELIKYTQDVVFPAIETDIEDAKRLYDLNFFSVIRMVKAFTPLLLDAGRVSSAHIFNIGSVAGEMATPYASIYSSAKAALKAWGDSLRVELAPFRYITSRRSRRTAADLKHGIVSQ